MVRHGLGVTMVCAIASLASAAPRNSIRIESTPPGASVYVNVVEDGEVCKTPCPIEVDADTTVIVSLVGHKTVVEQLVIGRNEKPPYKRSFALVRALGTILVDGPAGADVTVDKVGKGKAPIELDVAAGPHTVVIAAGGKQSSHQVEVVANEQARVTGTLEDRNDVPIVTHEPDVVRPREPSRRSGPIVAVSGAFSVGFRNFAYENVDKTINPDLNPEQEYGQMLAGPIVEFWPGTLAGVRAIRGLSVVLRFQLGLNSQVVETGAANPGLKTSWRSFEAGARHRWVIKQIASLEIAAGYCRDQYQFSGNLTDLAKVPDADYQAISIAARGSLRIDRFEPYAVLENRIVLSGGSLEDRFTAGVSVNGLRAALGVAASFGRIGARVEGALTRYAWNINDAPASGTDGAIDSIKHVSLVFGYAY